MFGNKLVSVLSVKRCLSTAASTPVKYPKSFVSHLKTQKLNAFNIGITFLTLSLSAQLVNAKARLAEKEEEHGILQTRVTQLESELEKAGIAIPAVPVEQDETAAELQEMMMEIKETPKKQQQKNILV